MRRREWVCIHIFFDGNACWGTAVCFDIIYHTCPRARARDGGRACRHGQVSTGYRPSKEGLIAEWMLGSLILCVQGLARLDIERQ